MREQSEVIENNFPGFFILLALVIDKSRIMTQFAR